jgi:hypothetical protein
MQERDVELFNDSIERCSGNAEFLRRFCSLFLASSDAVAKKFEHTDLRKQARMLDGLEADPRARPVTRNAARRSARR